VTLVTITATSSSPLLWITWITNIPPPLNMTMLALTSITASITSSSPPKWISHYSKLIMWNKKNLKNLEEIGIREIKKQRKNETKHYL
jgi:hypothetical protein